MKVVVAEDNRIEMKNIEYIIDSMEECELAGKFSNGEDAWNFLRENGADILVTDIQMAKMTGIELIKKISDSNMDIEKVIISGYADFNNAQEAIGAGVRKYILKPFLDDEFRMALAEVIRQRKEDKNKICYYRSLEKHFENAKPILREYFLRNLILNSDINCKDIEDMEKQFHIPLSGNYKTIVTFRIINNTNNYGDFFACGALIDYIAHMDAEDCELYPIMIDENEISMLITTEHADKIKLSALVIQLKNDIIKKYNIDMQAGVSCTQTDVRKLYLQTRQSREILDRIRITHKNIVMTYDEFEDRDEDVELSLSKLQRNLKTVVFDGDKEKVETLINQYISPSASKTWIRNFAYCYINILEFIMNGYGDSFDIILGGRQLWEKLMNFDSIINVHEWLKNITCIVIDSIHNVNNRDMETVKNVKEIIAKRYGEHLTAAGLAEELNFSQKQLFRIFAKATGNSISNYITEYRMEMAKKMILQGEKIYVVAEMVGYHDITYFRKLFKSYTGKTPQQFKQNDAAETD